MKHILITTIAAGVLVGCGPSVDIHQAVHDGDIQAVKQYLNASGDVNAKGEDGRTPLHGAVIGRQKEIVELLLAEGADVNAKNRVELTPLYHAAIYGHTEVAEFLIAKGANVNAKNKNGSTPLHLAAAGDRKEIVELFIAKSADVNAKNKGGRTPLDSAIAFKHTETADLLRKHGGKTAEEDSIHVAAKKGNIEAIKQHIANGADVNATNDKGTTPLDVAIRTDEPESANLLRKHGGKTGEELKATGN